MEIKKIIEYLNKEKEQNEITNWKIITITENNRNYYITKDYQIETELKTEKEEHIITIYKEQEETISETEFKINKNYTISQFINEYLSNKKQLLLTKTPIYKLPEKDEKTVNDNQIDYEKFYNREIFNEFEIYPFEKIIHGISKTLKEELNKKNKELETKKLQIYLNYYELFNTRKKITLQTSKGIKKEYKKTYHYFELAISAKKENKKDEKEHIIYEKINNINNYNFSELIKRNATYAADLYYAKQPEKYELPIILNDSATIDFFYSDIRYSPLITFTFAELEHYGITRYRIGKPITNSKYDKITLYSDPLLKDNIASKPFDELGITSQKICLIKDSIFNQYFASKKFADYIKVEPTGAFGTITLKNGNKTEDEIRNLNNEYIEIISFSWFDPEPTTGDFSSEIRLAYHIKDGKKTPFKGGLFTGNIFKILEKTYLSKEEIEVPYYKGPKILYFEEGKIIGLK